MRQVNRQINEMTRNITELEKAIAEKEGYMALAHTRLGKRAHRPQVELVRLVNKFKSLELMALSHYSYEKK